MSAATLTILHPERTMLLQVHVGQGTVTETGEGFQLGTSATNGAFIVLYKGRYVTLNVEEFIRRALALVDDNTNVVGAVHVGKGEVVQMKEHGLTRRKRR